MAQKQTKTNDRVEERQFVIKGLKCERREEGEAPVLRGYASVFNEFYEVGSYFIEKFERGAFIESIKEDDIRALFNHDSNIVLGRNRAGTLKLSEDERGLAVEIYPPDTQNARDVMALIERGDISEMSIGFRAIEQVWVFSDTDLKPDERTIRKAQLFDVSAVTFPASPTTEIALRSAQEFRESLVPEVAPFSVYQRKQLLAELD